MIMILQSIYFTYSKNWENLHYIGFALSVIIINMINMLPESPKYLYTIGRFEEAKAVLC